MRDIRHAEAAQPLVMTVEAVKPCRQPNHPSAGRKRSGRADFRILDDCAVTDRHSDPIRSVQVYVGRGLAVLYVLSPAVDMFTECVL